MRQVLFQFVLQLGRTGVVAGTLRAFDLEAHLLQLLAEFPHGLNRLFLLLPARHQRVRRQRFV